MSELRDRNDVLPLEALRLLRRINTYLVRWARQKLVDGERDQPGWCRCVIAFVSGGYDHERVGEHGEGCPAVPGRPAPYLVLIKAGEAFAGLEGLFDAPALPGHMGRTTRK